jgi:dihydropyrimidinase
MFDLIIRNARCASSSDVFAADIGIRAGSIAALGSLGEQATQIIDAAGRLVTPGGVESHLHIDQRKAHGRINADDFYSGTVSAACGGTTTVLPFAPQLRGESLGWAIDDYSERARKSVLDYNFHLVISDPSVPDFDEDLARAAARGLRSLKIFTTYAAVGIADRDIIKVFAAARRHGFMVMVHCENTDIIDHVTTRLLAQGQVAPKFHLASRPTVAEAEAVFRICSFAELFNVPTMIVHVSTGRALDVIALCRKTGATLFVETCTQYLALDQQLLDKPGHEGAKGIFSPPVRDAENRARLWDAVISGQIDVLSSDHSPYRFDEHEKFPEGFGSSFDKIASGVPGVEIRMPLLFTQCVQEGKIGLPEFVRLTATNAATIYGLASRKGDLVVGADADLCIWDETYNRVVTNEMMHHNVDFTPYEGIKVSAWPAMTLSRGEVVSRYHEFCGTRGRGQFVPAAQTMPVNQQTQAEQELAAFGASL